MKILLAEDDKDLRENLGELLEILGFAVGLAEDGKMALDMLLEDPGKYDMVLSDWVMPNKDGYELLLAMKAHTLLTQIPFVMLTARITDEDRRQALEAGAYDYITKPVKSQLLIECLEGVQKNSKT